VCAGAAAVLVCLLAWFAAEVVTGAGRAGLAEGGLGVAQAVWPLTVVLSCRHPVGGGRGPGRIRSLKRQRRGPNAAVLPTLRLPCCGPSKS
jgi:hypothetical protein